MVPKICSVQECYTEARCKELCAKHYGRFRIHGDPTATKRPGLERSPEQRLSAGTVKNGECWLWTGAGSRYGKTSVKGQSVAVHVLAYELAHGAVEPGSVVRHSCDTPKCVNPSHLSTGTYADNSRDMTERERQARGVRQGSAKMTDATVSELRSMYATRQANIPQLSKRYGVSTTAVAKIIHFKTWKHVTN